MIPLYETTFACGSEYAFFNKIACFFEADPSSLEGFNGLNQPNPQTRFTGIQRLANYWFILHSITEGCKNDPMNMGIWFQRHFLSRNLEKIRRKRTSSYEGAELKFAMMKFWTIMNNVEEVLSI